MIKINLVELSENQKSKMAALMATKMMAKMAAQTLNSNSFIIHHRFVIFEVYTYVFWAKESILINIYFA